MQSFFFTFLRAVDVLIVICNNTKENFLWEPEKINVKFHKNRDYTGKILKLSSVRCNFVKFDIHFLTLPWEIFFGVTTDHLLHLKPLKNVKKNAIFFKLFCYKIFVPWKLKLLNFLVDSILSWFWTSMLWSTDSCHNRVSTDQCHMTVLGAQVYNSILSRMFFF